MTLSSNFALKRGGGRNNEGGVTTREYGTSTYIPYLLDYTPPSNKRPPPLRGLSYCAGFLSRTHAPPPCSDPYMYVRALTIIIIIDRACAIRDIPACVCNVAQSFYSSIMSNNMKKI